MQYHGIASYKLEYQQGNNVDWITAKEGTDGVNASFSHTIENLTGGNSYKLRYTVTDNAGNTGLKLSESTTIQGIKNPTGAIENITTDKLIYLGQNSSASYQAQRKVVHYEFSQKTAIIPATLTGYEYANRPVNQNLKRKCQTGLGITRRRQ